MRDQTIMEAFAKIEKRINVIEEQHHILAYHFSAMQRVLRDKGLVLGEEHTGELMKMQKEINEQRIKANDKPSGKEVETPVPDSSATAGQVLPNKELPNSETVGIGAPSTV